MAKTLLNFVSPNLQIHVAAANKQTVHCGIDVTQLRLAFRPVWFSLFLKDSAAFLQMMSAAMTHRGYTHGLVNETKAMFLRQQAWMSVNDRLADPEHCTSDGTLAAILSFLILDVRFPACHGRSTRSLTFLCANSIP